MGNALLIAFSRYICQMVDNWMGWQVLTRPIVIGTITGLLCGDIKTGIIIGAELEAVYMGMSPIGGEQPSDPASATVLCVGFVVLDHADMATGLALAVTAGVLINNLKPLTNALPIMVHPWFVKTAKEGNVKKFYAGMWVQNIVLTLTQAIIVFFVALGGSVALTNVINNLPPFILKGLSAASGVMIALGLCLTTQAIWNGATTVVFILFGFVLTKYLGLGTLPVALIGFTIAFIYFVVAKKINDGKLTAVSADNEGGDDFYG
ncbi:MAG: PTS sugar transporter subunit IIC [Erysipelotrichaceae bacterium]|nr:PTS sugar transporter subunit IIC [Erysipelotrichaceae bacterium]